VTHHDDQAHARRRDLIQAVAVREGISLTHAAKVVDDFYDRAFEEYRKTGTVLQIDENGATDVAQWAIEQVLKEN